MKTNFLCEEYQKMNQKAEESSDTYYAKQAEYYKKLMEYMSSRHIQSKS